MGDVEGDSRSLDYSSDQFFHILRKHFTQACRYIQVSIAYVYYTHIYIYIDIHLYPHLDV